MPKPTQSLDELRSQARLTYRYWHIYLTLRLREVEQHLTPAQRAELSGNSAPQSRFNLQLLVNSGLWKAGEPMPDLPQLPSLSLPAAENYFFRVGNSLNASGFSKQYISLDVVALTSETVLRLELMRVRAEDSEMLELACTILNRIAHEFSTELAFEAGRGWAFLHGARVLNWVLVPNQFVQKFAPQALKISQPTEIHSQQPALPPRKRGKGMFRDSS